MAKPDVEDPTILVIDLNARDGECVGCGAELVISRSGPSYGLPMYEGEVVPVDSDLPWGGFDACKECHDAYNLAGPAGVAIVARARLGT